MSKVVKHILARVKELPAVPGVVHQLLAMLGDPNFSYKELVRVAQLDPGITAHILRVCNSPYYGLKREVTSLEHAMVYLGADTLIEIILSSHVVKYYQGSQEGYRLARGELWRHSMATALLSKRLAAMTRFADASTLFTAALLHDVGKLVLSEFVGEVFEKIEKLVDQGLSFVEAERKVLGVDHALLGGAVAKSWNFPDAIVMAIGYHHNPSRAPQHIHLATMVALSNVICLGAGAAVGVEGLAVPAAGDWLKEVGIGQKEVELLTIEVKDIMDQAQELLGMAG